MHGKYNSLLSEHKSLKQSDSRNSTMLTNETNLRQALEHRVHDSEELLEVEQRKRKGLE